MTNLSSTFKSMKGINTAFSVLAAILLIIGLIVVLAPNGLMAQEAAQQEAQATRLTGHSGAAMAVLAAGLALGISVIGAAIALSKIGSAAVAAIAEKPEITGRVIVFAGLAEGLAIWGLIIAVLILGKI